MGSKFKHTAEGQLSIERTELSNVGISSRSAENSETASLEVIYSKGWRVHCTTLGISLSIGLVTLEVTVIGTSIVTIVEALHNFEQQGWIVTGYLVAYTSLIIIWSKIGAVFGRKTANITSLLLFTVFSGGCGASQTINQLIINRAFQGVGAAGIMSSGIATMYDLIPKSKYPIFTAIITVFSALGGLTGPLIGGALSKAGEWRWAFLINVPAGAVLIILLAIAIPGNVPYQNNPSYIPPKLKERFSGSSLARLDISGTFLLLSGSVLLVTVILGGGSSWKWNSATSIVLFVLSGLLFILFLGNERIVSAENRRQEPLFPFRWVFNRAWLGVLLTSTLSGIPYNTIVIILPQRFQIIEGDSPLRAGVRLIPFNLFVATGVIVANLIATRFKIRPIWLMFFGTVIEAIGVGLLANLPSIGASSGIIYFYEILAGAGTGMVWGMAIILPPSIVEPQEKDIAGGAIFQTRVFGGALGLSIASTALNNYLTSHLSGVITSLDSFLADPIALLESLTPDSRQRVLEAFGEGYNLVAKIIAGFAAAQMLSTAMLWQKPQISILDPVAKGGREDKRENAEVDKIPEN